MKHNWDLTRLLLLGIQENTLHKIKNYNAAEIIHHFDLLEQAGYITVRQGRGFFELTPHGEYMCETLRDESTYRKALEVIEQGGGGAIEEVVVGIIERLKNEQRSPSIGGLSQS